jgi:hypothetical protein
MELFAETLSVVGALVLSVACGLLIEELLFGGLVRLFFARKPGPCNTTEREERGQQAGVQGERKCSR